ncbi:T-cell ecto-ADP-ribosyltransferase 1-like isoform X2 [Toxotes jaculatrix]|uniref:T-cell ecto-ADP-ribosyltransferase 1-like isoform X2 n=2 Tax=Toxotes jaculatrix TaxID=941984 RepID=UPI001B3A84C9|nr:T-cell ecto-ADP-ribosyltransferase 1-like isoform X2 [Toxotes jaculatrix]
MSSVCVKSVAVCLTAVMKSTVLIFAPLCWLLCWILPVGSKMISFTSRDTNKATTIPLNMAEDAVDDMYSGCIKKMTTKVKVKYFRKENKGLFKNVWKKAEQCATDRFKQKNKEDVALTKNHMQAICVYTSEADKFYETFNGAVRTNGKNYGTSFQYHSLHFWLTTAIQNLRAKQGCHITYRRSKAEFTGEVKQIIRFGSFTSTSLKSNLTSFGHETCFKILTCTGAFLKNYSYYKDKEKEVLIPPYEKFKIIKTVKDKSVEELKDCKKVYILESTGVQSNLNCYAVKYKKDQSFFFNWWSKVRI